MKRLALSALRAELAEPFDLFIGSISYEDRCRSILEHLDLSKISVALFSENENHLELHVKNAGPIRDLLGSKLKLALVSTEDPLKTADALLSGLMAERGARRVLVDISTFTHESLLILFRLLGLTHQGAAITFCYSWASEYSVGDPAEAKWLSRGIREVRSVLGYPGRPIPSRRMHLIVLAGFEHERATEIVRRYEPSAVSLGFGYSSAPDSESHHSVNRERFALLRAFFPGADEFRFECFDPSQASAEILVRAKAHPNHNVVVAPMNTKISTLGAALAATSDLSIQLAYSQAELYNSDGYSRAGEYCYIFDVQTLTTES